MCIDAQKQGSADVLLLAVQADSLGNRPYVPFVETAIQRRAPVPGCSECDLLRRHRLVRDERIVGRDEFRNIQEHFRRSRFSRQ